MITSVLIGLIALAIGIIAGKLILSNYENALRIREQCFAFHELRDRLQLLAVEDKLTRNSDIYGFLEFTVNMSIRNAGTMNLHALLEISRLIDTKARPNGVEFRTFVRQQTPETQLLISDVFRKFAEMLIVNHWTTRFLFRLVDVAGRPLRGVFRSLAKRAILSFNTEPGLAVKEARKFKQLGSYLSPHPTT